MKIREYQGEVLVAFFGLAAYAIAVINDFHTDDWLVLNLLRDGLSPRELFSMETFGRFRPLTNAILYLRYLLFGDFAAGYYILNMLLHMAFSVYLLRFLKRIGLTAIAATSAALLFAVYFPHYEAVLWLYGTIRIFGAFFWVASLWALYDFLENRSGRSLAIFAAITFLGYFVVEDMVVAPLGFAAFAVLFGHGKFLRGDLAKVLATSLGGLAIYFALRSVLIVHPGVVEEYYYPGFHIFSRQWEYLEWMMIPPPDHSYFANLARKLGPAVTWIWQGVSLAAVAGLFAGLALAFIRAPRQAKFFVLFIVIAYLPIIPLNYKVTSRNIYIPSIGLAVLAGYMVEWLFVRSRGMTFRRAILFGVISIYAAASISAIGVASLEYRKNQLLVAGMITDMKNYGRDLTDYRYVLLDHMPGRAIVGPAMIYRLGFKHEVIASNDPIFGPVDIAKAVRDIRSAGKSYIVFDYRDGHLIEATADYELGIAEIEP